MENKVAILIPIFNGIAHTLKCIESIKKSSFTNYEIVIIDDGSEDNSSKIINMKHPEITIIKGTGNLWWSGSMNKGIEYVLENLSEYDYVLLLNNDNIVKKNMIIELVKAAKYNKDTVICSKVLLMDDPKRLFFAGGYSSIRKGGLYSKGCFEIDGDLFSKDQLVEWCGGMGVLIPMKIIKEVGFFNNTDFPQYYGDADYFYRIRQKGYKILYNTSSICLNNRDQTGIYIKDEKVTLENIKGILFSIKSPNNLKVNIKFYFSHFNIFKGVSMCTVRYGVLGLRILKRIIKYNLRII
ncbi:glycosyltransferase family 2 protein [Neobacillus sp. YIM B06451]|uniref:glycosyltransferase family 2 protein n=1 Tax=Neobacillus sp. YIM B06451 TaxID=3070994 RepID=UPI00292E268D|nr:glycosyltransferase family 2 protein [Neobacillus sp. YIM B06451]